MPLSKKETTGKSKMFADFKQQVDAARKKAEKDFTPFFTFTDIEEGEDKAIIFTVKGRSQTDSFKGHEFDNFYAEKAVLFNSMTSRVIQVHNDVKVPTNMRLREGLEQNQDQLYGVMTDHEYVEREGKRSFHKITLFFGSDPDYLDFLNTAKKGKSAN